MNVSTVGDSKIINSNTCTLKTNEWTCFTKYITDATNIKLRFEGSEGADQTFQLYKLTVENYYFYESFNKMNVNIDKDANKFAGNNYNAFPASTSKLDNNNASINAKEAKNCIFINNTESYITPQISELDRTPVVLAFRAAGDSENPATIDLTSNSNCTLEKSSFTPTASTWTTYRVPIVIKNFNSNCQITFAGKNYFLDDVKIYYPSTIPLDEASNNSSIIIDQSNEVVNAALTRTLTGGTWNTLCLPFAIDQELLTEAVGSYNKTQFRILDKVEDNTFKFDSTETVPAGTPCLVKPTTTVTNPTFKGVTIEATVPTNTTSNGYGLWGTFSPIELHTDHTHAFLSSDQRLYYPGAGQNTMNGMRAYFVLPSQAQNARVQIGENSEQNGIKETCDTDNSQAVYDLSGRKMRPGTLQQGIYIINGKKTIIR